VIHCFFLHCRFVPVVTKGLLNTFSPNLITVQQDATVFSLLHFCRQLYMFRLLTPIIRRWYSCNYSFWYWLTGSTTIRSHCWFGTNSCVSYGRYSFVNKLILLLLYIINILLLILFFTNFLIGSQLYFLVLEKYYFILVISRLRCTRIVKLHLPSVSIIHFLTN